MTKAVNVRGHYFRRKDSVSLQYFNEFGSWEKVEFKTDTAGVEYFTIKGIVFHSNKIFKEFSNKNTTWTNDTKVELAYRRKRSLQ